MKFFLLFFVFLFPWAVFAQSHESHPQAQSAPSKAQEEGRVPVELAPQQQSQMGVKLSPVEKTNLDPTIRTVGAVTFDQRQEVHVHTRVNGWIEELLVDYVGKLVKKDQPLFKLYSPDLVSTQNDYLSALRIGAPGREIATSALKRLQFLGVPENEIQEIRKTGQIKRLITFRSPIEGYVIQKQAIQGQYVTPELELYDLANLSKIWVVVTLYEYDLPFVKVGDHAQVTLSYNQNQSLQGQINYIYPEIDTQTRTAKARVELETPAGDVKPGMFANVEIRRTVDAALTIPEDSVMDTGLRKIVFVKTNETTFEPREVKLGARMNNRFIVQEGLKEGDSVVSAANFLIDTESKLRAALKKGSPTPGHSGGHGSK